MLSVSTVLCVSKSCFCLYWDTRQWVVCSAGSDAKSQHRRALANLQSTVVEHEEQLKDMERRTLMVSSTSNVILRIS